MSRHCPNGHPAADDLDYCDECGSRIDPGAPVPPPVASAAPASATWTCPQCQTSQGLSRFCEACGEPNTEHPDHIPSAAQSTRPATAAPIDDSSAPATDPGPESDGTDAPAWTLTATADRAFFERMQAHNGPDAARLVFPVVYPPRQFALDRDQIFIGRRSRSRGIDPDIDLSAAPEDSAVSHNHAAIIATDGGWALVDIGSSNGTYLNGSLEPLVPNQPVVLSAGDRIHLGAWTTLTVSG